MPEPLQENLDNLDNQELFDRACQLALERRQPESLPLFHELIRREPTDPEGLRWYGETLQAVKEYDESITILNRALAHKPHDGKLWAALGASYGWAGEWDKSRQCYDTSLRYWPNDSETLWNRALNRLLNGDFKEGWKEYLAGSVCRQKGYRSALPEWGGKPLRDTETLFIGTRQGCGDTIQFMQLLAIIRGQGLAKNIVFEVQRDLIPLFYCQPFLEGVRLVEMHHEYVIPVDFDAHCDLMSLPHILGLELSHLPIATNYLQAPDASASFRANTPMPQKLRVGIVWTGSPNAGHTHLRDIPAEALRPLREIEGVQWVQLQKDALHLWETGIEKPALNSWADTANVIDSLDVVLSADTGVAHLAGAMGKECWILLPYVNDFRWLRDRADCPWYPSARLFRQTVRGEWGDVIEAVKASLIRKRLDRPIASNVTRYESPVYTFPATQWESRLMEAPE